MAHCIQCETCPECESIHAQMSAAGERSSTLRTETQPLRRRLEYRLKPYGIRLNNARNERLQAEATLTPLVQQVADLTLQLFNMSGSTTGAAALTADVSFIFHEGWFEHDLGNGLTVWTRTEEAFSQVQGALAQAGLQQALGPRRPRAIGADGRTARESGGEPRTEPARRRGARIEPPHAGALRRD